MDAPSPLHFQRCASCGAASIRRGALPGRRRDATWGGRRARGRGSSTRPPPSTRARGRTRRARRPRRGLPGDGERGGRRPTRPDRLARARARRGRTGWCSTCEPHPLRGAVAVRASASPSRGTSAGTGLSPLDLIAQATAAALDDAGLAKDEIDGLCTASAYYGMPGLNVGEHLGIRPRWSDSTNLGGASLPQPPVPRRRGDRRRAVRGRADRLRLDRSAPTAGG